MQSLITSLQMRDMEQRYLTETGTPSIDLMERAAAALCDAIIRHYGSDRLVFFACGPGGNGGDGYACARMYAKAGGRCALFSAAPPSTPDAIRNHELALAAGIEELIPGDIHEPPDIWVDALFGTGLSRAPEGAAAALIRRMDDDRERGSQVVAVDIPSGLDGENGARYLPCIQADLTVAFQFAKTGHWLADGLDVCGKVEVVDIGIPPRFFPTGMTQLMAHKDARHMLPEKPRNTHKGKNGHLLIVAGSVGMAGAAAICAQAALRSGVGLVTVACPESIVGVIQTLAPCAMAAPLPEKHGAIAPDALDELANVLKGKQAIVCGCGLSQRASHQVLKLLLECGLPTLLDADALTMIADDMNLRASLRRHHLITPHPGEAARLLGHGLTNPLADALALRALGCQALLKGATTVIPVGDVTWLSASGCAGMAKGGAGDCLSGLIGGLMAQFSAAGTPMIGARLARCAATASELHGVAGELAEMAFGPFGMTAMDIVEALPAALSGRG